MQYGLPPKISTLPSPCGTMTYVRMTLTKAETVRKTVMYSTHWTSRKASWLRHGTSAICGSVSTIVSHASTHLCNCWNKWMKALIHWSSNALPRWDSSVHTVTSCWNACTKRFRLPTMPTCHRKNTTISPTLLTTMTKAGHRLQTISSLLMITFPWSRQTKAVPPKPQQLPIWQKLICTKLIIRIMQTATKWQASARKTWWK